ncbi:MAG: hydantoinase/oxoprolinase family protein [Deltaproteobacteria bacterium]|nr:hydantoinase/oxoprolinase family protein [Deltaproteobacteria bacterium]
MNLIGVDVGGTFTDVIYTDTVTRQVFIHKVPTTSTDPSLGVISGITQLCTRHKFDLTDIERIYHGTTIATNALLEYNGARVGVITTKGYRDLLHIGRHQRPQHYSIQQEIPWQDRPLARRRHRKVVSERLVPPKGDVLVPLNEEEVRQAARELKAEGAEAIAVCFLFSYLNPRHEERARDIIREEYPEVFVATSASVTPQFREFERFTTTAMNAFVGPTVQRYITRLAQRLRDAGLRAELHIMRSNGGVATPAMIAEKPVLTLLSGPAAGVLGGAWSGALSHYPRLITFDMGGTSADIGVVTDGTFSEATARDTWIAGYPAMVPMIDIHTIGAGGGSIARIDAGGAFRVGPQSAGSQPGPAAYGRGGSTPTVTDANLVLGRLDKDNFLGGAMRLDAIAAQRVIDEFAQQVGLSDLEAAEGIITIVNNNMANAIRSRTVQKGIDPRDYALVAFGGAGPLHGAEVARMLSIPVCIVPYFPGLTSALGLLTTDLQYDTLKTAFQVHPGLDYPQLNADFAEMKRTLHEQFVRDGVEPTTVTFERYADARYVGQGYELRVPIPNGPLGERNMQQTADAFHRQHEAEYGHCFVTSPIEFVNIRVTGIGPTQKIQQLPSQTGGSLDEAFVKRDECVFRIQSGLNAFPTAFYRHEKLPLGQIVNGPAILLQSDSTTVIPPGCCGQADEHGNFIITIGDTA